MYKLLDHSLAEYFITVTPAHEMLTIKQ